MPTYPHTSKAKITVTLSTDLVRQLDALVDTAEARSRSQFVEEAVRRWLEERLRRDLETKTEEYYHSLSPSEQQEDKEWSSLAAEAARRLWDA
ncbi:MAG: ribbon-helix-helix domain-containing protein [Candidatus Methylomirabilia bacterium]